MRVLRIAGHAPVVRRICCALLRIVRRWQPALSTGVDMSTGQASTLDMATGFRPVSGLLLSTLTLGGSKVSTTHSLARGDLARHAAMRAHLDDCYAETGRLIAYALLNPAAAASARELADLQAARALDLQAQVNDAQDQLRASA